MPEDLTAVRFLAPLISSSTMPPLGKVMLLVFLPFRKLFFTVGGGKQTQRKMNRAATQAPGLIIQKNKRNKQTNFEATLKMKVQTDPFSSNEQWEVQRDMQQSSQSRCTLYLIQRLHEVLLCRYVPQHHSQFPFILHRGVHTAHHLHKRQDTTSSCVFVHQRR